MQLIEIASIACISLLLVLATYLLVKGHKHKSPLFIIGLLFLLIAFNYTDGLLYLSGFYLNHPQLAGWEEALVLLYGPLLLYFAQYTLNPTQTWTIAKAVHLVPFALFQTAIVIFYQALPSSEKQQLISLATSQQTPLTVVLFQLALITHICTYTIYARRLIIKHKQNLKALYSSQMISWAQSVYDFVILLLALSLTTTLVQSFGQHQIYLVAIFVIVATTALFFFRLLIKALDHPILSPPLKQTKEPRLNPSETEQLKAKILHLLKEEKAYTNADLTIKDLAEQIAEPMRDVSHVVNSELASNFYDLVNNYRIEAAKSLLQQTQKPITTILYDVGFNSKSSFNTQFKLKTGHTPSAYRKLPQPQ
jgi:AraC-like DNA-binding protein